MHRSLFLQLRVSKIARLILLGLAWALLVAMPRLAAAHDAVVPPVPLTQSLGQWPDQPHDHDLIVPVQLQVAPDGTVESVTIEASLGPQFDNAAIAAAKTFTFTPAQKAGKPVSARIRSVVRFQGSPATNLPTGPNASSASPQASTPPVYPTSPTPTPARTSSATSVDQTSLVSGKPSKTAPPNVSTQSIPPVDVNIQGQLPPRSASETVRTAENIRAVPRRTGSDALLVVPGVFLTQHSGEGKAHQIFLRGFDAVHGQDVEVWLGGVPVNEVSNVHGQGYADLHFVLPETIGQVRGQPGTFDPRQGDFAVAGTVRYDLALDDPGFIAKGTLGTFGTKRLFLAYHPPSMDAATFAAAELYSTDGFGPSRAASRASLTAQAQYDIGPVRARILAAAATGRFDSPGVLPLAQLQRGQVDRFATLDPKQGGQSTRVQVGLDLTNHQGTDKWSLAPYFIFRNLRLRNNFTGFLLDPVDGDSTQQINDSITVGATAFYRRKIQILHPTDTFEIGLSARNDWIDQSQRRLSFVSDAVTADLVHANVRATDIGAYIDGQIRPVSRLTIRGGLRADGLSYATENKLDGQGQARSAMGFHLGGKGTVDFLAAPGFHLLAAAGQGFRSPQARSLGDGERTPFASVNSFELGARYKNQVFDAYAAGFYTMLDKDLVFDHVTGRNESVPSTQRAGFSLDATLRPSSAFLATVSVTYTHASFTGSDERYTSGDLLPYVPQLVARTEAAFTPYLTTLWKRSLTAHLGFGTTLLHSRPLPYAEIGHDIFTADTRLGLRLKELELTADFTNLFDAKYYDGEFVYTSAWDRSSAPSLLPSRHVTIGPPFGAFFSLTLRLS
ncbi:MAG: TonB-dependent receptor [Polyangiaceae bacterium]|nr:TonB-dependent receptor [Polyangiaceae bacterium]